MKSIGVAIYGGTGFGGGELLRYLSCHPEVEVLDIVSSSSVGDSLAAHHPHLAGFYSQSLVERPDWSRLLRYRHAVIFLSLPHGESLRVLDAFPREVQDRAIIIDLSADLRLKNRSVHETTYPEVDFATPWREKARYSIPELHGSSPKGTRIISNPGCLASACAIAAAPLMTILSSQRQLVGALCFDAKTGTSGAGRGLSATMHHPVRHGNFEAYKVLEHRHEAEIRQALTLPPEIATMFIPHLLPVSRGIFVTMYATLSSALENEVIQDAYRTFYKERDFIRFRTHTPRLSEVTGTNYCDLAVKVRGAQIAVMGALDNLGKGMAGTAIQNMNILCGVPEATGLRAASLGLV